MVERFNCTLISILKKYVEKFGVQWDKHIPGIMWAYHSSVNPSYLLTAGHPQEISLLPTSPDCKVNMLEN